MSKYVTSAQQQHRRLSPVTLYDASKTPWQKHVVWFLCVSLLISPIERTFASDVNADTGIDQSIRLDPILLQEDVTVETTLSEVESVSLDSASSESLIIENQSGSDAYDLPQREQDGLVDTDASTISTSDSSSVPVPSVGDIPENTVPVELTEADTNELRVTVTSSEQVVFDKDSCVLVDDGTYYCRTGESPDMERPDGVYSFPDSDGDLEIFIQRNGELTQITFNTLEDAAPWYDAVSNTIVWHRSINDRYQIMSYVVTTGNESQLTSDTTNNMQPTRSGVYTAWQSWIDNNWEIVLFDGAEMQRITFAPEHDIAPQIRNGLLLWSRGSGANQTAEIYNIATGEFVSIKDIDGGIVSNPRMVVLYESRVNGGDVVVRGYDMMTGQIIPIGATPARVPVRIPNPDDTPEPRALIQPGAQKQDVLDDDGDDDIDGDLPEGGKIVTDFDFDSPDTLVLFDYGEEGDIEIIEEEILTEEAFTLDLRPAPTPEEEMQAELTLIIPSFNEKVEDEMEDDLTITIGAEEVR